MTEIPPYIPFNTAYYSFKGRAIVCFPFPGC